jgi:hypothetical protein
MLAYVFWHWRRSDVSAEVYESRQREFHASLTASPIDGFVQSASFAPHQSPIPGARREVYEDWYLVRDFAALGVINEAAVSAVRATPHAAAAAIVEDGAGGVYALKQGSFASGARYAHWFTKPAGMRYDVLYAELRPIVEAASGALWMRQMVLGPGREFCLQSRETVVLPPAYGSATVELRAVCC